MAKKYFFFFFITFFVTIPQAYIHAAEIGLSAGAVFPVSQFQDVADTGYGIGYHAKMNVYQVFNYGLAVNYAAAGDNRVDFWAVDLYPFIDWIFFRTRNIDFFTRGGIGLFHWESDNIWWLGSEGNGIVSTFGAGCSIYKNVEILANISKLYADFDVDFFMVRLGFNFDLGQ